MHMYKCAYPYAHKHIPCVCMHILYMLSKISRNMTIKKLFPPPSQSKLLLWAYILLKVQKSVQTCCSNPTTFSFCLVYSLVFANGPGDLGSIPDHVIPKTLKMVLDTSLLNTQHYKVRIKGKVEQSKEKK